MKAYFYFQAVDQLDKSGIDLNVYCLPATLKMTGLCRFGQPCTFPSKAYIAKAVS